ncbi:oxidoreductase [Oceanobacillus arenosus]|uniref:Oxidoreductase n=1 Tax=Oceanobacillus arenosus TaxID=1229153 RepID=A0A3D8PYP6_9BACI|nr:DoxX family protein [Oceanobacillus arenosus]RDW20289.1 oxidoreductase [Oceanobacillus arenosus]
MNKNEIGKVILRAMLGLIFFIHGLSKFQGGISNTVGYFDSIGVPGFLAYVVGIVEIVGGIALVLGIGTRIIAILFTLIMAGAILTAKLSAGFLGNGQMAGYELELALLAMSIYFILANKSVISLDQKMFNSNSN